MSEKRNTEEIAEFHCVPTACEQQWLYRIGEQGIIYSQTQNRFVGLDTGGVLAYQAFDAGASLHDLLEANGTNNSPVTEEALSSIFALSKGRFPESQELEKRKDWPELSPAGTANLEVHGIPMLVECPPGDAGVLCKDCLLSCPPATRPARFHLRFHRMGIHWTIFANGQETFTSVRDGQLGLALLHTVRSLLYDEARYDVAFHAAMVADSRHGLMLCAPRESGKSTLTAHLAANGFNLISDEPSFLSLNTASISQVEMPVSLKEGTWNILSDDWPQLTDATTHERSDGRRIKLLHPPPGPPMKESARLTHIVFPAYAPSSVAQIESISSFRTIALLNEGGMLLGKQMTKDGFENFLTLICATPAFLARYSSLVEADQMIRRILDHDEN